MNRIIAQFTTKGMSTQQYDQILKDLEAAGLANPAGRLYHIAGVSGDTFMVTDVWESEESFARFGETLMPLIAKAGVEAVPPNIFPLYNLIN